MNVGHGWITFFVYGIFILFGGIFAVFTILPFLYDAKLTADRLKIVVFGIIPMASFNPNRFIDAYIERGLVTFAHNPFRTLSLGNRLRFRHIVIIRRGIIKTILLTPSNPELFLDKLRELSSRN